MTNIEIREALLSEYTKDGGLYTDLSATAARLIEQMLVSEGVQLHSITHRAKAKDSLAKKLAKPEKDYQNLKDVTDLAAIRITTYFAEDVDRVAQIVEREFYIDSDNSIDKRKLLDPDRFGYQSLHYISSISAERCRLIEYSRFDGRKFEIQVRSILQHAWAEIEHDLGYKSAAGVPREIRRRFSRIAGLLELADDEFSSIRRELDAYAASMPREIREQPQNVTIDKISLRALLSSEETHARNLSHAVARVAGARLDVIGDSLLEYNARYLKFLEIRTIAELEQIAASRLEVTEKFAKHWLQGAHYESMHEGIGLLYLTFVLLAEQGEFSRIRKFMDYASIGGDRDASAHRIVEIFNIATI